MEPLRCCTFTGVDEKTNLTELARIARANPISEWGVLYSKGREAEENGARRYPRRAWIEEFAQEAGRRQFKTALHLCGSVAQDFLRGDEDVWRLSSAFPRVQLNVRASGTTIDKDINAQTVHTAMHNFYAEGFGRTILQFNTNNDKLCRALSSQTHDTLIDASGGMGCSPDSWPRLDDMSPMRCGFAGGIGADNIQSELVRISEASNQRSYWIDMEGKLRSADDLFQLSECSSVLQATGNHMMNAILQRGDELAAQSPYPVEVEELNGFWLNWWAGLACGYAMMLPPENATRPTYLNRRDGSFSGFEPAEYAHDLKDALDGSDVGCVKESGAWFGITSTGERVASESREMALLRGMIVEEFGPTLPANPGHHPTLHRHWVGTHLAEELPALIQSKSAAGVRP